MTAKLVHGLTDIVYQRRLERLGLTSLEKKRDEMTAVLVAIKGVNRIHKGRICLNGIGKQLRTQEKIEKTRCMKISRDTAFSQLTN